MLITMLETRRGVIGGNTVKRFHKGNVYTTHADDCDGTDFIPDSEAAHFIGKGWAQEATLEDMAQQIQADAACAEANTQTACDELQQSMQQFEQPFRPQTTRPNNPATLIGRGAKL